MFRHIKEQGIYGKAYIDMIARAFLVATSMLPLVTIAVVTLS